MYVCVSICDVRVAFVCMYMDSVYTCLCDVYKGVWVHDMCVHGIRVSICCGVCVCVTGGTCRGTKKQK